MNYFFDEFVRRVEGKKKVARPNLRLELVLAVAAAFGAGCLVNQLLQFIF